MKLIRNPSADDKFGDTRPGIQPGIPHLLWRYSICPEIYTLRLKSDNEWLNKYERLSGRSCKDNIIGEKIGRSSGASDRSVAEINSQLYLCAGITLARWLRVHSRAIRADSRRLTSLSLSNPPLSVSREYFARVTEKRHAKNNRIDLHPRNYRAAARRPGTDNAERRGASNDNKCVRGKITDNAPA